MTSLFDSCTAARFQNDPLAMRVYTSQLLGQSKELVLHGGGNTSVKIDNILYVKGSGWNLDTIEKPGFSPVNLDVLLEMATRESLSDTQMVAEQRAAMQDQSFPNPSIEAILHAIIPFDFVDHTHADAVVTLTNTPEGKMLVQKLYGENMLIIDYVMPGFELAKHIYAITRNIDWNTLSGMILMHHGVFTFDNDAARAYEKMIDIVTVAETYLSEHVTLACGDCEGKGDPAIAIAVGMEAAKLRGCDLYPLLIDSPRAQLFSILPNLEVLVKKGGLTPEHVIRIKPFPAIIDNDIAEGIAKFAQDYKAYFDANASSVHICLDLAPRYAVIKGVGIVVLGKDEKESRIIADIVKHTITAILCAEQLGGWGSLSLSQMFEMEYWELEQAKLKK
ncbi:class II aldolase/adducin family protein [Sulfuricurvum kujiense DSM 16994]|uniref:Class II aldolase/adducin family protein n=1 Tax=Sulfuricurvum kujiense (strain ATCC BAA-921 / DSM 16994 / JCM 11577 / YK-1) TaxID=709032 RepID=E4TXP9_SULKY|nr:class II aldolase/adducin family protein [Sulfuricurvum kujiense]ADR34985.1 class II aldolase/adducin family protein [Sulfuricurvum kujiense DSM 16994]